jgi:hypothetical protein
MAQEAKPYFDVLIDEYKKAFESGKTLHITEKMCQFSIYTFLPYVKEREGVKVAFEIAYSIASHFQHEMEAYG